MTFSHTTSLAVGHFWIFLALTCYSRTTDAGFIVRPRDTAVKAGLSATFNCRVNTNDHNNIWWTWTGHANNLTVAYNCHVSGRYQSRFAVETTEPGECNLIVTAASLADAATYTCIYKFNNCTALTSGAQLIVLHQVRGTVNITSTSIIADGVGLHYRCSVTFNGTIFPPVHWGADVSGARIRSNVLDCSQFSSVLEVTARRPEVPQYTCTIHFRDNQPNYTDEFTFTAIKVFSHSHQNESVLTGNEDLSDSMKIIIAVGALLGISVITIIILTVILCRRGRCSTKKAKASHRPDANVHELSEDGIGGRPQLTTGDTSPYTSLDPVTHDTDRRIYAQLGPT